MRSRYGDETIIALDNLIGRELVGVEVSADKERVTFRCVDGVQTFGVTTECCDVAWIEHLELPVGSARWVVTGHRRLDERIDSAEGGGDNDVLRVYQDVFATSRGDIVLEYRHASNGYYDGGLEAHTWVAA